MKIIWHQISIQTLLLPTRQNDVENRDKAYLMPRLGSRAVVALGTESKQV